MPTTYQQLEKDYHSAKRRIAELDAENAKLREVAHWVAAKEAADGCKSGMECAAEIADKCFFRMSPKQVAAAIRAKIGKLPEEL